MGIIANPTFIPVQPPISLIGKATGDVLQITAPNVAQFAPASGGGGGGLPARYAVAAAGGTVNNLNPGSGWPNSDSGARLIITPSATTTYTGLIAGNDGELIFTWNNAAQGSGFNLQFDFQNVGSTAANQFTLSGSMLIIPPQSGSIFVYDATIAFWLIGS